MKIKIEDRVRTVTAGYYNNKIGTVKRIENVNDEDRYIVYIETMDLHLAFDETELRKY